jgi:hypothetical protein
MLKNRTAGVTIILLCLIAIGGAIYLLRKKSSEEKNILPAGPAQVSSPTTDSIPALQGIRRLPDSTRVYMLSDVTLQPTTDYPAPRELTLDGDVFFVTPAASSALTIHTKLLTVVVTGPAALRVMAPASEPYAEVDVIKGNVIVRKAYSSSYPEPDTLHDGQMQMLNKTIDLMEKEDFDAHALKAWSERLPQ